MSLERSLDTSPGSLVSLSPSWSMLIESGDLMNPIQIRLQSFNTAEEESHGQRRSLAGHGPWGHRELDTTEATKHARTHSHTHSHYSCVCVSSHHHCSITET